VRKFDLRQRDLKGMKLSVKACSIISNFDSLSESCSVSVVREAARLHTIRDRSEKDR
jgi:hypothetical protein